MFLQTDDWLMQWSKDKCDASSQNEFFLYNKYNRGEKSVKTFPLSGYDGLLCINTLKHNM